MVAADRRTRPQGPLDPMASDPDKSFALRALPRIRHCQALPRKIDISEVPRTPRLFLALLHWPMRTMLSLRHLIITSAIGEASALDLLRSYGATHQKSQNAKACGVWGTGVTTGVGWGRK